MWLWWFSGGIHIVEGEPREVHILLWQGCVASQSVGHECPADSRGAGQGVVNQRVDSGQRDHMVRGIHNTLGCQLVVDRCYTAADTAGSQG